MLEEYPNGRCVYIAPLESLAVERYEDWRQRFGMKDFFWISTDQKFKHLLSHFCGVFPHIRHTFLYNLR